MSELNGSGNGSMLVVIVNYKTAALTVACLATLGPELEKIPGSRVVVVENDSGDAEALARAIEERDWGGWVTLDVADRNGGFAYGNNRAIRPAMASDHPPAFVLLLNSDTEVRPGALVTLIDFLKSRPDVGIAGSGFENLDGSNWPIAFRFITPISEIEWGMKLGFVTKLLKSHMVSRVMDQDRPGPVDWVAGACMLIRREVFDAIGLMDEKYFLYYEELDFCLRAKRAGWPCWYVPESRIMHVAGQSSGFTIRNARPSKTPGYWFDSRRRYFLKNHGRAAALAADLAYGLGFTTWRLRRAIQRKVDLDPPGHLRDFWKHSVIFRKNRVLDHE